MENVLPELGLKDLARTLWYLEKWDVGKTSPVLVLGRDYHIRWIG